uniref:Uncharacterized protein n=1 Tax=Mola mola TaxID=94237 RepID=A0A3Q3W4Y2_MOLML
MLYTELLRLWDEAVQAVDARDWQGALAKLSEISEPTSRTLFNKASAHLALGQLDRALQVCGAAVMMQMNRLEEALSDCIWAQKHMRGNMVIDYRQLGLRFKLYSWQVLYNAAAVYCTMGQWDRARDVLLSVSQERGGRGGNIEVALDSIMKEEALAPLQVPENVVFRPRKQDVEQLKQRDFLGKAKVECNQITSVCSLSAICISRREKTNKPLQTCQNDRLLYSKKLQTPALGQRMFVFIYIYI